MSENKPKTKEEKKLERKLQKAQEKLEKSQQIVRDYMTREKNFGKISHNRGWEDWVKFCRQVCSDGLRNDLEALEKTVDSFMDRSKHIVETIKEHRVHASEQHQRLFVMHNEMIEQIYGKYLLNAK